MSTSDSLENVFAIGRLLVFIAKIPIFIIGCFAQPMILRMHFQDDKRRICGMEPFAEGLGLTLNRDIRRNMKETYRFLRNVDGRGHYALNIMTGTYNGHEVTLFDYHTRSICGTASVWQYSRWFEHNYWSFLVLDLGQDFPTLSIDSEWKGLGIFSRLADALGAGDIDFESHEFSEKFSVRGKGKKFAYDFCNAQMMEHLLAQPVLHLPIEVEKSALAIRVNSALRKHDVKGSLGRLLAIRDRMPGYLFTG
jgi:hypothetical protein